VYPFREMHTGGRAAFGVFESFWGIGGVPAPLVDPNDAIFVVAMMENDGGDRGLSSNWTESRVKSSSYLRR
jgi:hypothetical protein